MSYKWSGDQTFGTANVGILNADTIKGASSTSNMSIGANLNGGSITIGSTNGTTNISGGTAINIGTHTTQTGNIAIGTNNAVLSGTNQIFIGASNKSTNISGSAINMSGLININTTGSGITTIGNIQSTTNISGTAINIGNTRINGGIFPLIVVSNSNNGTTFEPIFGQNSRGNINFRASFPSISDQAPRRVCDIYGGFNTNSWGSEYMAIGVGYNNVANDSSTPTIEQVRIYTNTITLNKPITPNYSYPVGGGRIGEILQGTLTQGLIGEGGIVSRISVSSSGVWQFSWNIQFVLINATYLRPEFHIYGVASFNVQCAPMFGQGNYFLMSGSYTSVVDSGPNGHGTIYMNYAFSGWNPYEANGNFRAVRIA